MEVDEKDRRDRERGMNREEKEEGEKDRADHDAEGGVGATVDGATINRSSAAGKDRGEKDDSLQG
jgi:hypothetical protein